jgi:hypothetical protein
MISHSRIYRARASLATHYYADQANDYYSRDGSAPTWRAKAPGVSMRPEKSTRSLQSHAARRLSQFGHVGSSSGHDLGM